MQKYRKSSLRSIEAAEAALAAYVPAVREATGRDITLERMKPLMAALGNPQDKLKVIHVAGTSGKTSTAYFIAAMLAGGGRKVGLSVSPHVDSVTERVQIDLQPVDELAFTASLAEFLEIISKVSPRPTYFELLVAFAYWYFAEAGVDFAVIETGLGGLHDGTNAASRADKVCVITDIDVDHTAILGDSLEAIAAQKAGIIYRSNTAIAYLQSQAVRGVLEKRAKSVDATVLLQDQSALAEKYGQRMRHMTLYQQRNWLLAREVCEFVAKTNNFTLDGAAVQASMQLRIPGRMDRWLIGDKALVMDGAHNGQKMQAFVESFRQQYPGRKVPVLLSLSQGKEHSAVLTLLRQVASKVIVTTFNELEGLPLQSMPVEELARSAREVGLEDVQVILNPREAFSELLAQPYDLSVITGSFYLVALVRRYMKQQTIRAIIAIDEKRGLANEQGIPWNLPSDRAYVRDKTYGSNLLMGYGTYMEFTTPLPGRKNLVVTDGQEPLRDGFEAVTDLEGFMKNPPDNLWVFGGSGVFSRVMEHIDELYITQLEGDFGCTKFFPEYKDSFELASKSPPQLESGINFTYQIWKRKD